MLASDTANPDSSVRLAVTTVRNKPDFQSMVSFSLNCILQALNPSNSRHEENLKYLLQEKFHLNLCSLLAKEREDRQMVGLCVSVALQLMEFDLNTVAPQMLNASLLKNIGANLTLLASSVEPLLGVFAKLRNFATAKTHIYKVLCSMLAATPVQVDDALRICSFLKKEQFVSMDRGSLLQALTKQKHTRVIQQLAELLWGTVSVQKQVTADEARRVLQVVSGNFGNPKISYLAYNILSPFFKLQELQQKSDKSVQNSLTYLYILAEEQVAFSPKITTEGDFIELIETMAEAGNLHEYLEKLFVPQLALIKGEQSQLQFISTLKRCCLKQQMDSVYAVLKGMQSRSKSPLMALQYEYLLKYANREHQLGKLPALPTTNDKLATNKKLFREYFGVVLQATVTFSIKYSLEESTSFAKACLKFISDDEAVAVQSIYFLERSAQMLFERLFKETLYQDLLLKVYELMVGQRTNEKKLHKIQKLMLATFTSGNLSELQAVRPDRLCLVLPVLLQNPQHFSFASQKLLLLKHQLSRPAWTSVATKFRCMFNLLQAHQYHPNIAQVFETFIGMFAGVLESEQDRSKKSFLQQALYYLKQVKKNSIFLQLQNDEKLSLSLDKLFFLMVRSVKMVRFVQLYDLLFELESWVDMQSLLRRCQAETVISSVLESHSESTTDALELLLVCLEDAPAGYLESVRKTRILRNLQDNMNRYLPQQLAKVEKIYDYFNKLISINYNREYPTLKQLLPGIEDIRRSSPDLDYMLRDQDCNDLNKIIKGSCAVLRGLATLNHKQLFDSHLDHLFEHQVKLLVGLLLWINDDQRQLPTDLVEALNSMLTFEFSSSEVVSSILKIIAQLPHKFNIVKLPLNYLVVHFINNLDILQYINDLLSMIADSSPQKLADYQLTPVFDKVLCSLVYQPESELLKEQITFLQNCIKCDKYHDHLLTRLVVLQKVLDADLTTPAFYRPFVVEFALDMLDREDDLKDSSFKLGRLLEKFADQSEICYLCTTALKDCEPAELQKAIVSSTLINVMMGHEDPQIKANCQQLLKHFAIDDTYQKQFISSFRKQQFEDCENLIESVEKPHELALDREDLNRLLAYHAKKKGESKLKDFLLGNSTLSSALYECENFYKFEIYTEDILAAWAAYDEQLQISAVEMKADRTIKLSFLKPRFDEKQMSAIAKKEHLVQDLAKKLQDKSVVNATNKLKLLCMYSHFEQLKPIVKAALTPSLLGNGAYTCQLYDLRLPLTLPESSRGSVVSTHLISHLRTHLREYQAGNEEYYLKTKEELLGRREKEGSFYLKLLEIVALNFDKYDSEFMVGLARDIVNSLEDNLKTIKFNSTKEEQLACTLELVALLFLSRQGEFSAVSVKKLDGLYGQCKVPAEFDMLLTVIEAFVSDSKDPFETKEAILQKMPTLTSLDKECTEIGKSALERLAAIKEPPKAAAQITAQIEIMKTEQPKEDYQPMPVPVEEAVTSAKPDQSQLATIEEKKQPDGPEVPRNTKLEKKDLNLQGKPYFKAPPMSPQRKAELAAKGADNLREYGQFLDSLIDAADPSPMSVELERISGHIFEICDNAFYYRKIVKLNIIEKLILAGSKIKQSHALRMLGKISKSKIKDLLREQHIVEYLKRELKRVLQTKQPRQQLQQVTAIMLNCEYEFSKVYFQHGLYSVLVEIAKQKLMQLEVLQFLNACQPDEKIINEMYQRGLIQQAVVMLKDRSNPILLAEWVKLIGKICINPAIQKKLMDLNIHESIANICTEATDEKVRSAAALSLGAIAINNPKAVEWLFSKQIPDLLIKAKLESRDTAADLCQFMYSLAFNNESAKKALQQNGGIAFLIKTYKEEASAKFPNSELFKKCLRALSTMCMHKELAEQLIKQRLPEQLISDMKSHHFSDSFSGILEALTNITRNIETPKEYGELKSQNVWEVLQFLKDQGLKGPQDEQNILILLFNLSRFEQKQMIDTDSFERIFWSIVNKSVSEQVTHMMVRLFLSACVNSKRPLFSEEICSGFQKICLKRTSDVFMPELVQIFSMTTEQEHIRMMSKYKIADILCDSLEKLFKNKDSRKSILETLQVMSREKEMAKTITSKVSTNLLDGERQPITYRIVLNLAQDRQNIDMLLQSGLLNAIRTDILAGRGMEGKYMLSILKTILGHCKLSKEDNQALVKALEQFKASTPDQSALLKQVSTLLNRKESKLSEEVKKWMWEGVLAKLYKSDGSVSELQVVITKCCKEVNCLDPHQPGQVKPKWRMSINDVNEILQYADEASFRKSNFVKSSFMGSVPQKQRCLSIVSSRNQFHICFLSKQIKDKWLAGLMAVQQYVAQMLSLLR